MSTVLIDTTDVSEASAILSANFTQCQLGNLTPKIIPRTRMVRSSLGSLYIDQCLINYQMTYVTAPQEHLLLLRIYSGAIDGQQPGLDTDVFRAGEVGVVGVLDDRPITGGDHRARHVVLSIERASLSEVAAGNSRDVRPVQLTGQAAVSPGMNKHLVQVIDHVCASAQNRALAGNPLLASTARQYLAASMLSAFPSTALLEPTIEDHRDSTPVLLRRAIAFVDDNAHREITLTDIAEAVYITLRALQYMFRKHRDCTPRDYLRMVRLNYAHRDLIEADPSTTTVGRIAARWSFGNPGRFTNYYRQQFGVSPHHTLRR